MCYVCCYLVKREINKNVSFHKERSAVHSRHSSSRVTIRVVVTGDKGDKGERATGEPGPPGPAGTDGRPGSRWMSYNK